MKLLISISAIKPSTRRRIMHERLGDIESAKPVIKRMIFEHASVKAIKDELKDLGIRVTAYKAVSDRGLVAKWRKLAKEGK